MEVYLDNSSTTRVRQEVLKEVIDAFENNYGNPSSIHRMGLKIEKKIEDARKKAASLINAKPEEIYFTGGGTESNNIAIFGHVGEAADGKNIITTVFEHPSVYNVYKSLEKKMKVNYLTTDSKGRIKIDELEKLVDDDTALLSFILVNNEIGIIQDVEKIVEMVKKKNNKTRIHIDAIQAYGKIKIDVKKVKVDSISFSSHKIHGPKGVGGLFVRQGIKLDAGIFGGGQEKGIRPGTENTPGIVGFGEACSLVRENFEE
jgi:cysteine desulfurase